MECKATPISGDAHKAIAQKHGHLLSQRETLQMESLNNERLPASDAMGDVDNLSLGNDLKSKKDQASMNEGQKVSSFLGNVGRQSQERQECGMSKAESTSRKRKQTEEKDRREPAQICYSPYFDVGDHGHGHLGPISSSNMEFGAAYRETRNWPSVANPLSGIEEHHGSLRGDSTDSRGYRNDGGQYLSDLETSQWAPHYGHQDHPHSISAMRNNFLSGHDAAHDHMRPSYGGFGSVSDSYMINTPAMQRYAPRLDELNHAGMNSLGSGPPIVGRNGTFAGSVPQPGFRSGTFAPGPNHAYSLRIKMLLAANSCY
ncbi:unnamed protein product [Lupinus luteus]|uniref:Uncharacterized protein n=1 Tax=Lupinus luteus TaxID=3873 RepID=A0AAV1X4U0_LUPLU